MALRQKTVETKNKDLQEAHIQIRIRKVSDSLRNSFCRAITRVRRKRHWLYTRHLEEIFL